MSLCKKANTLAKRKKYFFSSLYCFVICVGVLSSSTTYSKSLSPETVPIITSSSTVTGAVGVTFSYTITALNSPTSFSTTTLPAGLSLNTSTGVISGTPTVAGNYTDTVTATNSDGSVNQSISITILSAWSLKGNSGTNSTTNFIGTTDNNSLIFRTNNVQKMKLDSLGNLVLPGFADYGTNLNAFSLLSTTSASNPFFNIALTSSKSTLSLRGSGVGYNPLKLIAGGNVDSLVGSVYDGFVSDFYDNYKVHNRGSNPGSVFEVNQYSTPLFMVKNSYTAGGSGVYIGDTTNITTSVFTVNSNSKGILIPRVTTTQKNAISSPVQGLQVFDTTLHQLAYYNGTSWIGISGSGGSGWNTLGNSGTPSSTYFIGTIDNNSLSFRTNNIQRMKLDSIGNLTLNSFVDNNTYPNSLSLQSTTNNPFFNISSNALSATLSLKSNNSGVTVPFKLIIGSTDSLVGNGYEGLVNDFYGNYKVHNRGTSPGSVFEVSQYTTPLFMVKNVYTTGGGVYIGDTTNIISSAFTVNSTTKGILIPRVTTTQKNAIASPVQGLQVFDTTQHQPNYYNGTSWVALGASSGWSLTGNSIVAGANFIGSSNNVSLRFKTYNVERMIVDSIGRVGIGVTNMTDNTYNLYVEKGIRTRKVKVDAGTWADFVFDADYKLPSLNDVENYIQQNKHLSGVPSVNDVQKEGVDLGENQKVLLQKVEELTLYVIEQNKKIEALQNENEKLLQLEKEVNDLKAATHK